jgi:hypothetical protein
MTRRKVLWDGLSSDVCCQYLGSGKYVTTCASRRLPQPSKSGAVVEHGIGGLHVDGLSKLPPLAAHT